MVVSKTLGRTKSPTRICILTQYEQGRNELFPFIEMGCLL